MDIDKSEFIDDFIEDMNELMGNAEISLKKLEEGCVVSFGKQHIVIASDLCMLCKDSTKLLSFL